MNLNDSQEARRLARWTVIYDDINKRCVLGDEKPTVAEIATLLNYGAQLCGAISPLDDTEQCILEVKLYLAGAAGHFVTCLARTFEAADEQHLLRLHAIFPEFGAALYKAKTDAAMFRILSGENAE